MKNIFSAIVIIHLLGWGISSVYYDWIYKNEHDAVNSYFLSGYVGTFKGFFWELDLIRHFTSDNKKQQFVDLEENEYQIKTIIINVMQNPKVDMILARQELQKRLSKMNEKDKKELMDSFVYDLSIMQEYMSNLMQDAKISYTIGEVYKSDRLKELEKEVKKHYPEQFQENNDFLYNVAKKKPIQLPDGGQIIYDERLIQATIDNTNGAYQRLKELFGLI